MGCCGHDFKSIESVRQAVKKNTLEFKQYRSLKKFRDRAGKWDLRNGVCRNAVMVNNKVFCPLHPKRNRKDLRKGHCDTSYFCETTHQFYRWSTQKQKQFLKFIKDKKLDPIEYSVKIDNSELLKEFNQKSLKSLKHF